MDNQKSWDKKDIVSVYARASELQPPETTIAGLINDQLKDMTMLDIGVGGGRTTLHFAGKVKQYIGIDYAEKMITSCQQRFSQVWPQAQFHRGDARSLNFSSRMFDLVLFSFNGIGYIDQEGRLKALKEINRVLKPGGLFCFSAHNYYSMGRFLKIPRTLNPWNVYCYYRRSREVSRISANNNSNRYVILRDGAEKFRIWTYYIKPSYQLTQLHDAGFDDIRAFLETTGQEVKNLSQLDELSGERWIYFLCRKSRDVDSL